ncbi:hypothetical protein BBP40_011805 [Aspergillus hancockii]|nr:hypothetical protein BBP40_011805 [Aspergillus hancockii]
MRLLNHELISQALVGISLGSEGRSLMSASRKTSAQSVKHADALYSLRAALPSGAEMTAILQTSTD